MSEALLGFIPEILMVPVGKLMASRKLPVGIAGSRQFAQLRVSIQEVGLIEPLTVMPAQKGSGLHLLLDGHARLIALKELGHETAPCLVAKDDESYTYNKRINRLSTIQEHFMIRRAIERGVSKEYLAKALSVDLSLIEKKVSLLDGICPEATELLQDRQFSASLSRVLRQMKPLRQVESIELMVAADNVTVSYAEALLAATPPELLVEGKKPKKLHGVTEEQMQKMEREMANVQGQFKLIEQGYGQDVLNLTLARGYLLKLLDNKAVGRYLKQQYPEFLEQFQGIVEMTSLDGASQVTQLKLMATT